LKDKGNCARRRGTYLWGARGMSILMTLEWRITRRHGEACACRRMFWSTSCTCMDKCSILVGSIGNRASSRRRSCCLDNYAAIRGITFEAPYVHPNKPSINKSHAALSGIGKQWLTNSFPIRPNTQRKVTCRSECQGSDSLGKPSSIFLGIEAPTRDSHSRIEHLDRPRYQETQKHITRCVFQEQPTC
jgi:hypothetical protein